MGKYDACTTNVIFKLRREGKLLEALKLCETELGDFETLSDKWEVAAAGWTLVDLIEKSLSDVENPMKYVRMLEKLDFTSDEVLSRRALPLIERPEMLYAERLEASGNPDAADMWAGKAFQAGDESSADALRCRTALARIEKALSVQPADAVTAVKSMNRLLGIAERGLSSAVRAKAAGFALKLAQLPGSAFSLVGFVQKLIDAENLKPENYVRSGSLTGFLNALAAEMLEPVTEEKSIRRADAIFAKEYFLDAVENSRSYRGSAKKLDYSAARIAFLAGEPKRALKFAEELTGVAGFSCAAWLLVGDISSNIGDSAGAARAYASACQTGSGSDAVTAACKLVKTLLSSRRKDDALAVLTHLIESRRNAKQPVPKALTELLGARGMKTAKVRSDGGGILRTLAGATEESDDLSELDGVVGKTFSLTDPKSGRSVSVLPVLVIMPGGRSGVITVAASRVGSHAFDHGTSLKVRCKIENDSVKTVRSLILNEGPKPAELPAAYAAVIEGIDPDSDLLIVRRSRNESVLLSLASVQTFCSSLCPGDVLMLRTAPWSSGESSVHVAIEARKREETPPALVRDFEGQISVFGTEACCFGEVKTDSEETVSIRPVLMTPYAGDVRTGMRVKGRASCEGAGWRAISLELA